MSEVADLTCNQKATFVQSFQYLDSNGAVVNLTGYSARMMVKGSYDTPDVSAIVDLSSSSGGTGDVSGISIVAGTGTLTAVIAKATTATLTPGSYVYDLKITDSNGRAIRLVEGCFLVSPGVTP